PRSNSVLLRNLYYYAWGGTLRSGLEAELGPVGLRAEVDHHTFEAIRRRHRREDVEHSDLPMHDTRTYARGWLELRPLDGIAVSAGIEERRGSGTIGDVTLDAR
ncbi:MAG: hypothetical protein GWM90_18240, partial [Gemmatimonadetes bacterium]|nr:hypothetical protein [Gemmatimonadota bacterium]NIQ56290.1 hypothetical protein [Gemmatimonadota bacterium]NIU74057.1 hypothetical protein [Gammaproteobacteria bacterium]NIX45961.1 hypothetical protein [Gemmatimonadota bacterium]NIY10276.1 hypothetical protein [Gemmatimonadota bacterium]